MSEIEMTPLSKGSSLNTYNVRIIGAWTQAPDDIIGKTKYIYRVKAWPSDLQVLLQETTSKWVRSEFGDESEFEPASLTFRHHSSLSTLMVSLQKMSIPPYQSSPLPPQTTTVLMMDTGSVPLPTEMQKPIVHEISSFDEHKVLKAMIKVSLLKA